MTKKVSGEDVNEVLVQELHKPVIKKFKGRKFCAMLWFKDNICEADLAEMVPLSSFNQSVKYLLRAVDALAKYVKPLKDEKYKTALLGFINVVNKSKLRPIKSWISQGKHFYNSFM